MQRIAATAKTDSITSALLSGMFKQKKPSPSSPSTKNDRLVREIKAALEETRGNYSAAAKLLGIHRMTLHRRMQKLQIDY
jgi:ActR/RegA family two-component response regulator